MGKWQELGSGIRWMALFSYMGVLCLVPLVFNRDDDYVDFHARQGLVMWIWGVLAIFSLHIPVIGPFFFSSSVFFVTVMSLAGIVSVLLGKRWKLPIVSLFANKF